MADVKRRSSFFGETPQMLWRGAVTQPLNHEAEKDAGHLSSLWKLPSSSFLHWGSFLRWPGLVWPCPVLLSNTSLYYRSNSLWHNCVWMYLWIMCPVIIFRYPETRMSSQSWSRKKVVIIKIEAIIIQGDGADRCSLLSYSFLEW